MKQLWIVSVGPQRWPENTRTDWIVEADDREEAKVIVEQMLKPTEMVLGVEKPHQIVLQSELIVI